MAVQVQSIECTFGGDGIALSWEAVEGEYEYLEVWYSADEIEDSGIVLARLEPQDDGSFATETLIPPAFVVNPEECIGCAVCVGECPTDAIEMVDQKAIIDPEKCISCGICAQACPVDAIYAPSEGDHFAVVGIDAEGSAVVLERL
jgi:ferredoxin